MNRLYNIITDLIELKMTNTTLNTVVIKGFGGTYTDNNKRFILREYNRGTIYVFTDLYNSVEYNRKEAFDVLGPCFLTLAVKKNSDINKSGQISEEIVNKLDLINIWKSETSRNFVIAKNQIESKEK